MRPLMNSKHEDRSCWAAAERNSGQRRSPKDFAEIVGEYVVRGLESGIPDDMFEIIEIRNTGNVKFLHHEKNPQHHDKDSSNQVNTSATYTSSRNAMCQRVSQNGGSHASCT
jgi:hypothetical protein